MVKGGARAVMMYLVQRQDGSAFSIAGDIDPAYRDGLQQAMAGGVEVLCYACTVSPKAVTLARPVPLALDSA